MKIAFYIGKKAENQNAKLFDIAVAWWTKGRYSHCEMVFNDDLENAMCASSSQRDGGVRMKLIDLTTGRWDVFDLKDCDEHAAYRWFDKHNGKKYDIPGLFGFVLPWRTHHPNRWFCSEACAAALGIESPHKFSPNGLYRHFQENKA